MGSALAPHRASSPQTCSLVYCTHRAPPAPPRGSAPLHHPRGRASPPSRDSYSRAPMKQRLNTLPRLWDWRKNTYPDFSFFSNPTSHFNLPKKTPTDSLLGGNHEEHNSSSLSLQRSAANSTNRRRWPSPWCRDEAKYKKPGKRWKEENLFKSC